MKPFKTITISDYLILTRGGGGGVTRGSTGDLEGLSLCCHGNMREEGEFDWCVHVRVCVHYLKVMTFKP